jgi:hypothetical protein
VKYTHAEQMKLLRELKKLRPAASLLTSSTTTERCGTSAGRSPRSSRPATPQEGVRSD